MNVVATYHRLLQEDADLTMPVAAIESLIFALANTPASTVSETLDLISKLIAELKKSIPNSISLSAGTDLFQQYLITSLQRPTSNGSGDFEQVRTHLVQNGKLFVKRAKEARDTIASFGRQFVRDGDVILTNGGSRVVGALLRRAARSGNASNGQGSIRFKVIYVLSSSLSDFESASHIAALRALSIPVATIPPTALAFCLDQVTQCFVGAEGVVENGGIINRMGTYQVGMLAKAKNKPFYVVTETHKFVRLFPVGQGDLGFDQNVIDFSTKAREVAGDVQDEGVADVETTDTKRLAGSDDEDAVDYTPPNLISGIITESGVLLPSAVSEELIKIWF